MSEDADNDIFRRYQEVCRNLNLDVESETQAWQSYEDIRDQYTLEGDPLHWLGCTLYVTCRKVATPSVGQTDTIVQGNGVNLTRLLRLCKLSLLQFFNKCLQWVSMAKLPPTFIEDIKSLQKHFQVSIVLFQKFQVIFYDIFASPTDTQPKQQIRSRKSVPCTPSKVFDFTWTFFVYVKGVYLKPCNDLVESTHYLFACCDFMFANAVLSGRYDLINPKFEGLPADWNSPDFTALPSSVPCIIDILCRRHNGSSTEAKVVKEYHWKKHVNDLFQMQSLRGNSTTLSGVLEPAAFDMNLRTISKKYETHVLSTGKLDEKIFLDDEANFHIGSQVRLSINEINDQIQTITTKIVDNSNATRTLPATPLTGRRFLQSYGQSSSTSPPCVAHLHALLTGRTTEPSTELVEIFNSCAANAKDVIDQRINEMGSKFIEKYVEEEKDKLKDAQDRFNLAKTLYYKLLEEILRNEKQKKPHFDLKALLDQDIFHQIVFICSLEITLFCLNPELSFPWSMNTLGVDAYYFYKILEPVVSIKDHLSRDIVKHLNTIEEKILQQNAWDSESPLWKAIDASGIEVPRCEDVTLPSRLNNINSTSSVPANKDEMISNEKILLSPGASQTSAAERFQSPVNYNTNRKLFSSPQTQMVLVSDPSGKKLSVLIQQPPPLLSQNQSPQSIPIKQEKNVERKAKRSDSIGLFFRKFYYLASVRLQHLCSRLNIQDTELQSKIFTFFEYSVVKHTHLMKDRHLDQFLMCAVYVVCRVVKRDVTFSEIIRCYRMQPQSAAHVYRDVLIRSNNNVVNGTANKEERGDLIKFYNNIYQTEISDFALKFTDTSDATVPLSPLPINQPIQPLPTRRVLDTVYVRSHNSNVLQKSPTPGTEALQYCFSRSPANDLRAINNMISSHNVGKRLLADDSTEDSGPLAKRNTVTRILQNLLDDRMGQSQE